MWIVRIALQRPYTFVVLAMLILIMGALAIVRTPTDIFPNINIPVVSIIWTYNGLVPEDMADRIVSITERALTTTVDNIEHIESQSLYGIAVRMQFQTAAELTISFHLARPATLHDCTWKLQGQYCRMRRPRWP
jgi:multidrug efflux pump subunit AcrB